MSIPAASSSSLPHPPGPGDDPAPTLTSDESLMVVVGIVAIAIVVAGAAVRPRTRRSQPPTTSAPFRLDALVTAWKQQRARRRAPSARAVAAWCDDIARRIRSGSSLRDAATEAPTDAAVARAIEPLLLAVDRGRSLPDAAARVETPGPHLRLALGVLVTSSRLGGPSAAPIDRTAVLLRQRAADHGERSTQAAQARLSTHVMTAVPLGMLAVLVVTDADVRSVATSPTGMICIGVGLLLNAAGWWWMRRIVRTSA